MGKGRKSTEMSFCMDINNVNRPPLHPILANTVSGRLKTTSSKPSHTKFKSSQPSSTSDASKNQKTSSPHTFCVTALDALMFHDSTEKENKRKNIQWGNDLLDQLESLRTNLLTGNISHKDLMKLSQSLNTGKETITDPQLHEIIREIEIRVAVELAKLGII